MKLGIRAKVIGFNAVIYTCIIVIMLILGVSFMRSTVYSELNKNINNRIADINRLDNRIGDKALLASSIVASLNFVKDACQMYEDTKNVGLAASIIQGQLSEANKTLGQYQKAFSKIHIHTADGRSLYRSWTDKKGDDISFRTSLKTIANSKKPMKGIELGKSGFTIRGIAPIISNMTGELIGTVEVMTSIKPYIKNSITGKNEAFGVFSSDKALDKQQFGKKKESVSVGEFLLLGQSRQKLIVNQITPQELKQGAKGKTVIERGSYRIALFPIIDMNKKQVAVGAYQIDISDVQAQVTNMLVKTLGIGLIVLILSVILLTVISGRMVKNITRIAEVVKAMSDGDFTHRIKVASRDELGMLATHYNHALDTMNKMICTTAHSAEVVQSESSSLASTTEQFTSTFNEQAMQVSDMAAAMEELSATAEEVLQRVSSTAEASQGAAEKAEAGQSELAETLNVIRGIHDNTNSLATTITNLQESSGNIGEILTVINDIADQTNLLALNAAIEAARAGEAGRGFAVVADEVRKLAERTQKAISEVDEIIGALQSEAKTASTEMESAKENVDNGVRSIDSIREVFEGIVGATGEVSEYADMVTQTVQEQVRTIQNTNESTQTLSSGITESTQAVNSVSETVNKLQNEADNLSDQVGKFKTEKCDY